MIKAGQNLAEVVEQKCGDAASALYGVHLKQINPSLQINLANPKLGRSTTVKVPACAKYQFDRPIITINGDTLESLVNKSVPIKCGSCKLGDSQHRTRVISRGIRSLHADIFPPARR